MDIDIKIINEHTFNNWGSFDILYKDALYNAKWEKRGSNKILKTSAPEEVYKRVYNYLFND